MCSLGKEIQNKSKGPWMRCESIYVLIKICQVKLKIPFFLLRSDLCDPFQMLYQNQCEQEDLFCGLFCLFECVCIRKTESTRFLCFRIKASSQHNLEQLFQNNSLQNRFELVPALSYSVKSCWVSYGIAEEPASHCPAISGLAEVGVIKMQSHVLLHCRCRLVIRNWRFSSCS